MEVHNYEYKPTTSLKKISKLIKRNNPLTIIQGGAGAGKTISLEMLIIDWFNRFPDKQITICSFERTKLMDTAFHDFKKILIDYGLWYNGKWNENKSKFTFNHGNTGFIEFIGLDKDDIGKGRRRDFVYINEANKISHKKYTDISLRAKRVVIDYNSDAKFWAHDYKDDDNFISLTFRDNEFIPEEEKQNILSYLERGFYDPEAKDLFADNNIKNPYFANLWKVYGLGLTGGIEGQIFTNWKPGVFDESLIAKCHGLDWGFTDPLAMVEVAVDEQQKKIYLREKIYQTELTPTQMINIVSQKVTPNEVIVCDSADPSKIAELANQGYNVYGAWKAKGSIIAGIGWLQEYELIVCDSPNLENELNNYVWAEKKSETPIDANNHLIDAVRYAYDYIRKNILFL